jgi:Ran GTPase-activating protein (RanGAP) involved in mRNA processing and transport
VHHLRILDLDNNDIGAQGAGRLAAVLGQCASLAHLDLGNNDIIAEGAGRLAAVLGQCASLAHLDLSLQQDRELKGRGGLRRC